MQIHWRNVKHIDEAQRMAAEDRLEKLAEYGNDLINVTITSKSTAHHRHGGQEIHIVCHARGSELVATRCRPDTGQALTDALGALGGEKVVEAVIGLFDEGDTFVRCRPWSCSTSSPANPP